MAGRVPSTSSLSSSFQGNTFAPVLLRRLTGRKATTSVIRAGKCPFGFHGDALKEEKAHQRLEAGALMEAPTKGRSQMPSPYSPAPSLSPGVMPVGPGKQCRLGDCKPDLHPRYNELFALACRHLRVPPLQDPLQDGHGTRAFERAGVDRDGRFLRGGDGHPIVHPGHPQGCGHRSPAVGGSPGGRGGAAGNARRLPPHQIPGQASTRSSSGKHIQYTEIQ